jgi:hypothetical protein
MGIYQTKGYEMTKIDKLIQKAKNGEQVLQFIEGQYAWFIVYLCGDFFIEKYRDYELVSVECIDEATARFAFS